MRRWLLKSWQNRRPGWTRRIRWYDGTNDIRLEFTDEHGTHNMYFTLDQREEAQREWEAAIAAMED